MVEADALSVLNLFPEGRVLFVQMKKCGDISLIDLMKTVADITGPLLFVHPFLNGISAFPFAGLSRDPVHHRGLSRGVILKLGLHLLNQLLIIRL